MSKQLFWIGKGTIKHNGKILDPKKPLPKDISEKFIKDQIKLKNIGEKIEPIETVKPERAKK